MIIRDFVERCHRGLGELGLSPATHDEIVEGRELGDTTTLADESVVTAIADGASAASDG